jgi:alpha-ribazole phosphatase
MHPTRWWWVRHAPVYGHGGRIYGQTDHPADCGDHDVFEGLARILPSEAVILVSNLRRTQQTAAAILAKMDGVSLTPRVVPELAEQHFGVWQGMTHDQVHRLRQAEAHRFWLAPAHERPDGGESFVEVMARVRDAIERLSAEYDGRDVIAVAHGGSIRAALALALNLDPEAALRFSIDNCSVTRLDRFRLENEGRESVLWRVTMVNQAPGPPG